MQMFGRIRSTQDSRGECLLEKRGHRGAFSTVRFYLGGMDRDGCENGASFPGRFFSGRGAGQGGPELLRYRALSLRLTRASVDGGAPRHQPLLEAPREGAFGRAASRKSEERPREP